MDLSFARRRKAVLRAGTPDLDSLLSAAAVRQAVSPTARAQVRDICISDPEIFSDPRIAIFAPDESQPPKSPPSASFAAISAAPVNTRQSS